MRFKLLDPAELLLGARPYEGGSELEEVTLTAKEFCDLPEYSGTLPTGMAIGKQWKRNNSAYPEPGDRSVTFVEVQIAGPDWWLGEYIEHKDPNKVGIRWRRIRMEGP